jgi:hypothetical protein
LKNGHANGASVVPLSSKPLASLSLDLDNLWSYMKIHGDHGWESFPSYLDPLVDIVVPCLRARALTLTVFVVGQDAALSKNARALRSISDAGHEMANHSFSHEPWFHTYSYDRVVREIADAEVAIERATGQMPRGFRGPGFSLSGDTLRVLSERDYLYDASTFPTFLGPLARAYYFFSSKGQLSSEEREKRKQLFGTARDGLRDLKPYLWALPGNNGDAARDGASLLEIPVTTMPFARVPIHMSYVLYLAVHSLSLARAYVRTALAIVEKTGHDLSFLLHPLDFMGKDMVRELAFFPGMQASTDFKLRLFDEVLQLIAETFRPVTMRQHARVLLDSGHLKVASLRSAS